MSTRNDWSLEKSWGYIEDTRKLQSEMDKSMSKKRVWKRLTPAFFHQRPRIWMMSVYENHNAHIRRKSRGIRGEIRRFSYTNWPGPLTKKWTVNEYWRWVGTRKKPQELGVSRGPRGTRGVPWTQTEIRGPRSSSTRIRKHIAESNSRADF